MLFVHAWRDLEPFGMVCLTGEACGLSYRILFDVTERGKQVLAKCLGIRQLGLAEPWNRGSAEAPHVGSILLPPEMFLAVGVFALLEHGCTEVWQYRSGGLLGVEAGDRPEQTAVCREVAADLFVRRFAYAGTAGNRNRHVMNGRVT